MRTTPLLFAVLGDFAMVWREVQAGRAIASSPSLPDSSTVVRGLYGFGYVGALACVRFPNTCVDNRLNFHVLDPGERVHCVIIWRDDVGCEKT